MIISLDTETTGVDWAHGSAPFLVTTACDDGKIRFWEWDVDPLTRRPQVVPEDVVEIAELVYAADLVYLHNAKFDAHMLDALGLELPWEKVRDTLAAGHLLATNQPHTLDWMCVDYLGRDIAHFERDVKEIVQACRSLARRTNPEWKLADEGVDGMPSVKGSSKRDEDKPWKNDMWLPRALANYLVTEGHCHEGEVDEAWLDACSRYANADSENTLLLGLEVERHIRERGLWAIYLHRLELLQSYYEMERDGVTIIGEYTDATILDYQQYTAECAEELCSIASRYGHELELAAGASINDNMRDLFYGAKSLHCPRCGYSKRVKHWLGETAEWVVPNGICPKCSGRKRNPATVYLSLKESRGLGLPVISTKDVRASLDKEAMAEYLATLEGEPLDFIRILLDKRQHETDLTYMQSYRRFGVPVPNHRDFYRIHSSLNPCATDHLRAGSNSPNLQNVGKQEDEETGRLSVRNCFGPAPGREWWSMDFRSIERRIPPYECGEEKMIEVFERPDSAPYWGSLYYLTASVLYPDEFWPLSEYPIDSKDGFKKRHPRLYKQSKFFDLAKQYGAGRRKGDLLSKVKNSYDLVDNEFPKLAALQAHYLTQAERTGWVQTLPDRTVDPERGYPILASRTEDGRVLSTTPFNYHVSGTACWAKNTALVRCTAKCAEWRREGFDARVILEVHDEILFDFPRGRDMEENKPRALILKGLMERSGDDLIPRIPTPVSLEYHSRTWAEGVSV